MPKASSPSTAKSTSKAAPKKSAPKATKAKAAPIAAIEKVCAESLEKLQSLNLDIQLQADMGWCLGSYRHDGNPVGLYEMAARAVDVFKAEAAKKTKGVTPKLIKDLEKVLKERK